MDLEQLRAIVRLLKDEGLSEITVSDGETTVTVRQTLSRVSGPAGDAGSALTTGIAAPTGDGTLTLTSPLVGTFYRRPTPNDEPFVVPGQIVKPGDTVCIVEAMKVMNEIKAEFAGRLRAVLVDEGSPVEYGQPLLAFDAL
ncbi:MAG: biotin/lipoyl-containing protein [Candidatus Bipolaricaulota bacterium]